MRLRAALVLAALSASAAAALAAEPTARASFSRRRIMPTEQVRYTITLTAERLPRAVNTPVPNFAEFDVLDGPSISRSQQVSIVNAQVEQWEIRTYSWLLAPKKEGQLAVPPVTVDAGGGKAVQAGREVLEVVTGSAALPPSGVQGQSPAPPPPPPPQDRRARAEPSRTWQRTARQPQLELVAVVDRTEAWIGQELTLEHLLRYDVNVETFAPKSAPDFPGFANTPQDLDRPEGRPVRDPATGATTHHEALLARWSLVPLAAGNQAIPSHAYVMTLDDPFSFLRGGPARQANVATQPVTIRVKPLPGDAPASFSGAVGSFRLAGSIDATTVKAGDGLTLTLEVEGAGSFRGVSPPRLAVPQGLKSFDPEVTEKAGLDPNGRTQGRKTFRYPVLVTQAGVHEIPAVEWSFFDPSSARYVTRRAGPFVLTATPGEAPMMREPASTVSPVAREVEARGADIRHLPASLGSWRPDLGQDPLPGWLWGVLAAGPALNLALLALGLLSRARTSDPSALRARSASKRAKERLREARAALGSGKDVAAADAVSRAVSGVVSDRLQLGAQLAPGEAAAALVSSGLPHLAVEVERLLHDCDIARFASGASSGADPADLVKRGDKLVGKLVSARLPRREAA